MQHLPGDRREYFSAPEDVWMIFKTLAEERKKREVDPTLSMLRDAVITAVNDPGDKFAQQRMKAMHDLIELVSSWFTDVHKLDQVTLVQLMTLGSKVQKLLEVKGKLKIVPDGNKLAT